MVVESQGFAGVAGILRTIKDDVVMPTKMDYDSWAEMQIGATCTIRPSLSDQVLYHVMDLESSSENLNMLKVQFLDKTASNKLYLKQKLYGLRMQEWVDLTKHVNEFKYVVLDLARIEVKVEDDEKALLMLNLLPKSYKALVVTPTYGKRSITSSKV
jgi:hypothetical protein